MQQAVHLDHVSPDVGHDDINLLLQEGQRCSVDSVHSVGVLGSQSSDLQGGGGRERESQGAMVVVRENSMWRMREILQTCAQPEAVKGLFQPHTPHNLTLSVPGPSE